jgi:hypothetical protein
MDISQNKEFRPITIVLKTRQEARAFWNIMVQNTSVNVVENARAYVNEIRLAEEVCDYFQSLQEEQNENV